MKRIIALLVFLGMMLSMGNACAAQHTTGTVTWKLDTTRTYEPGTVIVKRAA